MLNVRFPTIGEDFVGRYRIEMVVGAGGFSQVYRARQVDLGRDVAIKVLKPVLDASKSADEQRAKFEQVARRFEREAKLISRLKDRNTVMMYDYGRTDEGLLYMVLEFVDGITIAELLMNSGPLAPERVVKILRQALQSLHEAHTMDVLHRDIKPGNVMVYDHVGHADLVKVLDFGIAKSVDTGPPKADGEDPSTGDVTADGVLVGTPRYMSPEQIRGKRLGPGSDIYSLGLMGYEMLMGTKAIDADSSLRIIARHLDTDPILVPLDPSIPDGLRQVVNTMLLKDPSDRYQTCNQVLAALEGWDKVAALQTPNEPTMTVEGSDLSVARAEPTPPPSSANRWLIAGIAAISLVIVGMLAVGSQSGEEVPAAPPIVAAPLAEPAEPPDEPAKMEEAPEVIAISTATSTVQRSHASAERTAVATAEFALRDRAKAAEAAKAEKSARAARKRAVKKPKPVDTKPAETPKPKKKPKMFSID